MRFPQRIKPPARPAAPFELGSLRFAQVQRLVVDGLADNQIVDAILPGVREDVVEATIKVIREALQHDDKSMLDPRPHFRGAEFQQNNFGIWVLKQWQCALCGIRYSPLVRQCCTTTGMSTDYTQFVYCKGALDTTLAPPHGFEWE
jgi:hypothetical protein